MRTIVGLSLLVSALGCAIKPPPPISASESLLTPTFTVSSAASHYAIRGSAAGTIRLSGDDMEVVVSDGWVEGIDGAYRNVRMAVGVGTPSGTSWRLLRVSDSQPLASTLEAGRILRPDTLRFVIRGLQGVKWERDWFVIQLSAEDMKRNERFRTYICAETQLTGGVDPTRAALFRTAYEVAC